MHYPFKKYLYAGLIAGAGTAVVNNLYHVIYSSVMSFSLPSVINPISISLASIIPLLIASVLFFSLNKFTASASMIYTVGTAILALLSLAGPFGSQLPDDSPTPHGFAALAAPMHVCAGVFALFVIPRFVKK